MKRCRCALVLICQKVQVLRRGQNNEKFAKMRESDPAQNKEKEREREKIDKEKKYVRVMQCAEIEIIEIVYWGERERDLEKLVVV